MFQSREEAALKLVKKLKGKIKEKEPVVVVSLTRGGVVIGKFASALLNLPLDILVLKKIGDPLNRELAIGIIGPKNVAIWNEDILRFLNLSRKQDIVKKIAHQMKKEQRQQEKLFRKVKKPISLKNKRVILVDDGIATGATVLCAQKYLKKEKVKEIILAAPVISADTLRNIKKYFDTVVCLKKPIRFSAVSQFYRNFPQIANEEVVNLLK